MSFPALSYDNGSKRHYRNGKLHNDRGPAVVDVYEDCIVEYYFFNGKRLSKNDEEAFKAALRQSEIH